MKYFRKFGPFIIIVIFLVILIGYSAFSHMPNNNGSADNEDVTEEAKEITGLPFTISDGTDITIPYDFEDDSTVFVDSITLHSLAPTIICNLNISDSGVSTSDTDGALAFLDGINYEKDNVELTSVEVCDKVAYIDIYETDETAYFVALLDDGSSDFLQVEGSTQDYDGMFHVDIIKTWLTSIVTPGTDDEQKSCAVLTLSNMDTTQIYYAENQRLYESISIIRDGITTTYESCQYGGTLKEALTKYSEVAFSIYDKEKTQYQTIDDKNAYACYNTDMNNTQEQCTLYVVRDVGATKYLMLTIQYNQSLYDGIDSVVNTVLQ